MAFVRVRNRQTGQQKVMTTGMAHSLRDKYEVITEGAESTEAVSGEAPAIIPNAGAAAAKAAGVDEVELANARADYEKAFGEKPHGRLKIETLKKLTAEKNGQA